MSAIEKGLGLFLVVFTIFFWFTFFPIILNTFCTTAGCAYENISSGLKPLISTGGPVLIALATFAIIIAGIYMMVKSD